MSWDMPSKETCEICGAFMLQKSAGKNTTLKCSNEKCPSNADQADKKPAEKKEAAVKKESGAKKKAPVKKASGAKKKTTAKKGAKAGKKAKSSEESANN
jgi:DNA topoisomerase-1